MPMCFVECLDRPRRRGGDDLNNLRRGSHARALAPGYETLRVQATTGHRGI